MTGLLGVTGLAGCAFFSMGTDPDARDGVGLERFPSCDALADRLADRYVDAILDRGRGAPKGVFPARHTGPAQAGNAEAGAARAPSAAPSADMDTGGAAGPAGWSETNVQEQGVDEPDLVETDGTHLFVVRPEGALEILDAFPAEDLAPVAHLALEGIPQSMFLAEDRAVVFSRIGTDRTVAPEPRRGVREVPPGRGEHLRISIIDVSQAEAPAVVREIDIDAGLLDARLIGDDVYVVTERPVPIPRQIAEIVPSGGGRPMRDPSMPDPAVARLRQQVSGILAEQGVQDALPYVWDDDLTRGAENDAGRPLVDCNDLYGRAGSSGDLSVVSVAHIKLNGGRAEGTGILAGGSMVYASPQSLYVAEPVVRPGFAPRGGPGALTAIHRFDLARSTYVASGLVEGTLIDPYAMSEHDGYLRVATTDAGGPVVIEEMDRPAVDVAADEAAAPDVAADDAADDAVGVDEPASDEVIPEVAPVPHVGAPSRARIRDPRPAMPPAPRPDPRTPRVAPTRMPANNIFVLDVGGSARGRGITRWHDAYGRATGPYVRGRDDQSESYGIPIVGALRGIAPNEQIRAARFLGDKAFLVTFRQTDPLFAIDLSDPQRPAMVGRLEIPGFSTYLHPIDEDTLLAVGVAGDARGATGGVAVSLFDVSDLAHPRRVDELSLGMGSGSEALGDPHAFLYYGGVLAIPVTTQPVPDRFGRMGEQSSALWVLGVDTQRGLWELGRIDHDDLGGGQIRRAVGIDSDLYSISDVGVKANDLYKPDVEISRTTYGKMRGRLP
jgi:hypothetical protein